MLLLKEYINLYTHPEQSEQIINIIKHYVKPGNIIVDANGGMGGDSIFFCKYFDLVYLIEINSNCIDYIENNLKKYKNTFIINHNCMDILKLLNYDVVYFDPPWGGRDYKDKKILDLYLDDDNNNQINILNIIDSLFFKCKNIFLKAPLNFNCKNITDLLWKHKKYYIQKYYHQKPLFYLIVFFK